MTNTGIMYNWCRELFFGGGEGRGEFVINLNSGNPLKIGKQTHLKTCSLHILNINIWYLCILWPVYMGSIRLALNALVIGTWLFISVYICPVVLALLHY